MKALGCCHLGTPSSKPFEAVLMARVSDKEEKREGQARGDAPTHTLCISRSIA